MRNTKSIRNDYFDWLLNFNIGGDSRKYISLCTILHQKIFRWFVHNDDNRCEDGIALRYEFINTLGLDENHLEVKYFLAGNCTVLELLVALAKRINDYMYDLNPNHDDTAKWFFEMLTNLRVIKFKGTSLSGMDEVEIDDILENFMDRTYDYYGTGSLFPIEKRPKKDMSTVEIWYQLMEYLNQKYG